MSHGAAHMARRETRPSSTAHESFAIPELRSVEIERRGVPLQHPLRPRDGGESPAEGSNIQWWPSAL